MLLEMVLDIGDNVINLNPHRSSDDILIPRNARGVIDEFSEDKSKATVVWWMPDHRPHGYVIKTEVTIDSLDKAR